MRQNPSNFQEFAPYYFLNFDNTKLLNNLTIDFGLSNFPRKTKFYKKNSIAEFISRKRQILEGQIHQIYKAHPIKLCKTGNIRSNFKKLVTFGNLKVLPFQNSHQLLDQAIFVDFISILARKTMIFECKIQPCICRPIWPKI